MSRRPAGSTPSVGSSRKMIYGIVDERLGDTDALLHSLRVALNFTILGLGHADTFEKLVGALSDLA